MTTKISSQYRIIVTLERGIDRPKFSHQHKLHPTYQCMISVLSKTGNDTICRCLTNAFFADHRLLKNKITDTEMSRTFAMTQPFPPSFTKSIYGFGLSKAQLEQRHFLLSNWMKELISLFPSAPDYIQKAVMEFFYVHSMNRIEFTNKVFMVLKGEEIKSPLSIPTSIVTPSSPKAIPISIPSNFSHEVKVQSYTSSSSTPRTPPYDKRSSSHGSPTIVKSLTLSSDSMEKGEKAFPRLGIAIQYLPKLLTQFGGREQFQSLTTAQVYEQMIKPSMILATTSTFCEWLLINTVDPHEHPIVGLASIYIIHAWNAPFLVTIDSILAYFGITESTILSSSLRNPIYVWINLFSDHFQQSMIQQNPLSTWWIHTYPTIISSSFQKTIIIFPHWNDFLPLSRTWCLYELYSIIVLHPERLECIFPPSQQSIYLQQLLQSPINILQYQQYINIEQSQCSSETERSFLIALFQQTIGCNTANQLIQQWFQQYWINCLHQEMQQESQDIRHRLLLLQGLGCIYLLLDQENLSIETFQRCYEKSEQVLGIHDLFTLDIWPLQGIYYGKKGNTIKAIEYLTKGYEQKRSILGDYHPATIDTYLQLGIIYYLDCQPLGTMILQHCLEYYRHYQLQAAEEVYYILSKNIIPMYQLSKDYEQIEKVCLLLFMSNKEMIIKYAIKTLQENYQSQGIYEIERVKQSLRTVVMVYDEYEHWVNEVLEGEEDRTHGVTAIEEK